MSAPVTRRGALAGIGMAGVAAAVPAMAASGSKTYTGDRMAWDRTMRALDQALSEANRIDARLDRVDTVYRRACAKVPHVTREIEKPYGYLDQLTTENPHHLSHARESVRSVRYLEDLPGNYDHHRHCQQFIDAAEARQAKIDRIDKRLGWSAINDLSDAQWIRVTDLQRELLDMPAPDGAAVMWKVEHLYSIGSNLWNEGYEDQTHADLRRFLTTGRA